MGETNENRLRLEQEENLVKIIEKGFSEVAAKAGVEMEKHKTEWGAWICHIVNAEKPQDYVAIEISGVERTHEIYATVEVIQENSVVSRKECSFQTNPDDLGESIRSGMSFAQKELTAYFADVVDKTYAMNQCREFVIYGIEQEEEHLLNTHYSLLKEAGFPEIPTAALVAESPEAPGEAPATEKVEKASGKSKAAYMGFAYAKNSKEPVLVYGNSEESILETVRKWNQSRRESAVYTICNIGAYNPDTDKYKNFQKFDVKTGENKTNIYLQLPKGLSQSEFDQMVKYINENGAHFNTYNKRWYLTPDQPRDKFLEYLPDMVPDTARKMKKFEVGKTYQNGAITFEITGRTEKVVSFVEIQHFGRVNERRSEEKKAKIRDWGDREVFMKGDRTIEASEERIVEAATVPKPAATEPAQTIVPNSAQGELKKTLGAIESEAVFNDSVIKFFKGINRQYVVELANGEAVWVDEAEIMKRLGTEKMDSIRVDKIVEVLEEKVKEHMKLLSGSEYDISISKDFYDNRCTVYLRDGQILELHGDQFGVSFPSLEAAEVSRVVEDYMKREARSGQHQQMVGEVGDNITLYVPEYQIRDNGAMEIREISGMRKIQGELLAEVGSGSGVDKVEAALSKLREKYEEAEARTSEYFENVVKDATDPLSEKYASYTDEQRREIRRSWSSYAAEAKEARDLYYDTREAVCKLVEQSEVYVVQTQDGISCVPVDEVYDRRQTAIMERAINSKMTSDQLDLIGQVRLSAAQMEQVYNGFKDGLSVYQVGIYATPDCEAWKMDLYRYGMGNGLPYRNIKEAISNVSARSGSWEESRRLIDKLAKAQRNLIIKDLKENKLVPEKQLVRKIERLNGITGRLHTVKGIMQSYKEKAQFMDTEAGNLLKEIGKEITHQKARMARSLDAKIPIR